MSTSERSYPRISHPRILAVEPSGLQPHSYFPAIPGKENHARLPQCMPNSIEVCLLQLGLTGLEGLDD